MYGVSQVFIRRQLQRVEYNLNGLSTDEWWGIKLYHFWMGRRKFLLNELLKVQIREFRR